MVVRKICRVSGKTKIASESLPPLEAFRMSFREMRPGKPTSKLVDVTTALIQDENRSSTTSAHFGSN
ncbi:hypothetical protein Mapa_016136 [Marchantia paleacea]|nr:hypothetical protein Mapa_016136 [Marchantia paleacea]